MSIDPMSGGEAAQPGAAGQPDANAPAMNAVAAPAGAAPAGAVQAAAAGQPGANAPPTNYPLESYKLLADMVKQEESVFWTRNQLFVLVNSGLIAILVGILGLQTKPPTPQSVAPSAAALTQPLAQGVPGQPQPVFQQIIYSSPSPPPAGLRPAAVYLPLMAISILGVVLCGVWALIVARGQLLNDHLVNLMKEVETSYFDAQMQNLTKLDALLMQKNDPNIAKGWPRIMYQLGHHIRVFTAWFVVAFAFLFVWMFLILWVFLIWIGVL